MKIKKVGNLPFISATLVQGNNKITVDNVLLDSGSAACVFSTDKLRDAGIVPTLNAKLRRIVGVGGTESVVDLPLDSLTIGSTKLDNFVIEIGAMDYGFDIEGIVGFDYLEQAGVIIDFDKMEIR